MMLNTAQEYQDFEGIADYNYNIAENLMRLNLKKEAIIHLKDAANAYAQLKIRDWEAKAYRLIGFAYMRQNKFDDAEKFYKKALDLFELIDDKSFQADVFINLSMLYSAKHAFIQGMEYADKAINIYIDIGNIRKEAIACINFCSAALGLGEISHCENYLKKAYSIFSKIEDDHHVKLVIQLATFLDEKLDTTILNEIVQVKNYFIRE